MRVEGTATGRPWLLRDVDEAVALAICQRHGLPDIVGRVLAGRGLEPHEVPGFLEPRLKDCLPDPSHLLDLDAVARRLAVAVIDREPVGIIGDYDVDGATSTALAVRYFRALGVEPVVEIPDRLKDGYGANEGAFERLAEAGCRLVLTLDNGTTAFGPIAHAADQGQEVVVIDHHAAEERLPAALGVVNPNRLDQQSPLGHLAAVGVTFVVLIAVSRELRRLAPATPVPDLLAMLDLVALGTVCDVVPLTGLNRAFVHQGLRIAGRGGNPGLKALAEAAGVKGAISEAWQFGFALGPRINAGGRLGHSPLGWRLLATRDEDEAVRIAAHLDDLNRERQAMERRLLDAADAEAQRQLDSGRPVLVAAGEGWHPGVIGIVASRLMERYHRPVFVIGMENGTGKGSARSVPGFDVGAAVIAARQAGLLVHAGGHAMAAGLTVEQERLGAFADFLAERATGIDGKSAIPERPLHLDGRLSVAGLGTALATDLARIAPFGAGNEEPRFCLEDARIVEWRDLSGGHVSCTLAGLASGRSRAIAFRCADTPLGGMLREPGTPLRLAGRIKLDRFNGETRTSFQIEDAAPA